MKPLETLANAAIGRREFVIGVAAGTAALATGIPAASASTSGIAGDCIHGHAARSRALGRFVCDPANDAGSINLAIRTAACPECGTRLSADLTRYALSSRMA